MPSLQELVERELKALRAVDGVSSATSKERSSRQSLNCSQVKVRLVGHDNPITVHCSARVPNLLVAAERAATLVAAIVGEGAVAEGRLRAEAACEAESRQSPLACPLRGPKTPRRPRTSLST